MIATEEQTVQFFPLREEFNATNVDLLVKSHITLSKTAFSLILIGDASGRDSTAVAIAYLQKKSITKVILSTMTDMADLLGSYEQVEEGFL